MHRSFLFTDFVTLITVLDPITLVPLFLAATVGQTPEARRKTALRCVLIAAAILVAFIVGGQILLEGLGISMPAFRAAGGVVLLIIALMGLFSGNEHSRPAEEDEDGGEASDPAVFPLAVPLIAGPGAITAVVLLTNNNEFSVLEQAETTLVLLGILVLVYAVLRAAGNVQRVLGKSGIDVVGRVSSLILAALSMETILQGVGAYFSIN